MLKCYRAVVVFAETCITVSAHDLPQYLNNRVDSKIPAILHILI